jgi:hypothetical protein
MTIYRALSFFCYFAGFVGALVVLEKDTILSTPDLPLVIGVAVTGVLFQFMHDVVTELRSSPPDAPSSVSTSPPPEEETA